LASQADSLCWNDADQRNFVKMTPLWARFDLIHTKRLTFFD
jgi:hypothetical protein